MIDAGAVNAIAELARDGQTIQLVKTADGKEFSNIPLTDVRVKEPEPRSLKVSTLQALIDYVRANRDGLDMPALMMHVASHSHVELVSVLVGDFQQRFSYIAADCRDRFAGVPVGFRFGHYLGLEAFNIALQALFEDRGDRAKVLELLGAVVSDGTVTQKDDGVTQTVTARAGIVMVDTVKAPNPVRLSPFRTFPEIAQPESPFILRLQKQGDEVAAALFEADGGAWMDEAITDIGDYLRTNLPPELKVIA